MMVYGSVINAIQPTKYNIQFSKLLNIIYRQRYIAAICLNILRVTRQYITL